MSHPVYYVVEGDILPIPFTSYDGATGASEAISGLAVTDIEIYKDTSVTQRSSDAGYALIDTDGIDIDSVVGFNGFSVDLSDNTDAGFYEVGPWYTVVVASITADTQTVNFIAAQFRIVSATRGLAGTALPAAAADAAGGLPISDAGGLDMDAILSRIGTPANLGGGTATLAGNLADIEAQTDDIGAAGAGLTAVPWNAAWDAEVQSEAEDALQTYHLDHLIGVADPGGVVANNSFLAKLVSKSATAAFGDYDNTTESFQALRDRGDAAWITATGFSTHSAADVWAVATRALTDKSDFRLSTTGVADIWAYVVEGTWTAVMYMRLMASALLAKCSGMGTTTAVFRDVDDTKNRLSVTVDADGNRSAFGTRDGT